MVSLNTDEFVAGYKGHEPVMTFDERREVLESCRYVTSVVRNVGGSDSRPSIDVVGPAVIAIGSDWQSKDYHAQMGFTQRWLDDREIEIVYLLYTPGVSSTDIKNRVRALPSENKS